MSFSLLVFFISIIGIYLSEVFNNYNRLQLSAHLVMASPLFLFLLAKIEKKTIVVPMRETITYLIFLIFSAVSVVFAIDKEIAIRSFLIYVSAYFFFLFSFNYSDKLNKYLKWLLVGISISSCLIFLVNNAFHLDLFKKDISLFYNYGHYQIGNLLVIGLLSIFPNPLSILFFVFILFSYSRTANIALMVVFMIQLLKNKLNKKVALIGGVIMIISLLFIIFKTNFHYWKDKQLFRGRNIYFSYALSSIREFPLFGLGPGNFEYAVFKRQVNNGEFTDSAENLILEVLAENGILAGIFFMLFIFLIFYKHKKNNNFLIFLALSLIFMTDFSFHFYTFLILWFVIGGQTLDSKRNIEVNLLIPVVAIFIAAQLILLSQILLKQGLWRQSLLLYPFQKSAYETVIAKNIINKNKKEAFYFLEKYDQLFGRSLSIFKEIAYYNALAKKEKVVELYEKSLWFRTYSGRMMKPAIYFYKGFYGQIKGNQKMSEILKKIKKSYLDKEKDSDFYNEINNFCINTRIDC